MNGSVCRIGQTPEVRSLFIRRRYYPDVMNALVDICVDICAGRENTQMLTLRRIRIHRRHTLEVFSVGSTEKAASQGCWRLVSASEAMLDTEEKRQTIVAFCEDHGSEGR